MDILIVEDDISAGEQIFESVKQLGHHAELTDTGEEALKKVSQKTFDLILLDVMLPDGFGYEKIPDFKAYHPDVNIIVMTGYNTPEMERTVRELGITYYMAKPININELKDILEHFSNKRKGEANE
jgi:DNA-binding response OmpR family regulator